MKNCKQLVGVRVLRPALGQLAPRKARLPLPHKDLGRQRPFLMMPSQRNGTRVLKSELSERHVQAASHWGGQELESLRGAAGVLLSQIFPRARVSGCVGVVLGTGSCSWKPCRPCQALQGRGVHAWLGAETVQVSPVLGRVGPRRWSLETPPHEELGANCGLAQER